MASSPIDWSFFSMNSFLRSSRRDDDRVLGAQEWNDFLDQLRVVGETALRVSPSTVVDRASAFYGLLQALEFGMRTTMGAANPVRPRFSRAWQPQLFDWGAANPDAVYRTVNVRDDLTYRIHGRLGNSGFMSFEFFDDARQTGSLVVSDLQPDAEGKFEVLFGPKEREGNWLKVMTGTGTILSREFFPDWATARPASLRIDCLDAPDEPWPIMTADRVSRQLGALGTWMNITIDHFGSNGVRFLESFRNAFRPEATRADSDLPYIYNGFWDLSPSEALLIEMPAFESPYWGLQTANSIWSTMNFVDRQSSLNASQTKIDDDGMVRVVLAHEDPGVANWLDTSGLQRGVMMLRITPQPSDPPPVRTHRDMAETVDDWMRSWEEDHAAPTRAIQPPPATHVIAFTDLLQELPAGTARVDRAERHRVLDERSEQIARMQAS